MELLHGTSQSNASLIEVFGALPRQDGGNWGTHLGNPEGVNSLENFVYLTNQKFNAEFYAFRSALINGDDHYSLVHFDVDENNLYPDENYWLNGIVQSQEYKESQEKVLAHKNLYKECLDKKALVAHFGPIPPAKIKNIVEHPLEESRFWGWIKNFDIKDIKRFSWSWNIHLHLVEEHRYDLVEIIPTYLGGFKLKCKNVHNEIWEPLYGGYDLIREDE